MEPPIVHSLVFMFSPRPFSGEQEESRTFVFGNSLHKEVEQVLLNAEPQLPSVIVDMIMSDSHPSPDLFVRRSWVNKAFGIKKGLQGIAEKRLLRQGVNAFVDFEKIFASSGIAGYGWIHCMKINATQVKRVGKNFSRTITIKFATTATVDGDGNESFNRQGVFDIDRWALLPPLVDAGTRFGV